MFNSCASQVYNLLYIKPLQAAKRTVSVKKRCERENNRASEELFNLLSDHPVSDGEGDVEVVREKRKSGGEDDVEVLSETPKSKRTKLTVSVYTVVCNIILCLRCNLPMMF